MDVLYSESRAAPDSPVYTSLKPVGRTLVFVDGEFTGPDVNRHGMFALCLLAVRDEPSYPPLGMLTLHIRPGPLWDEDTREFWERMPSLLDELQEYQLGDVIARSLAAEFLHKVAPEPVLVCDCAIDFARLRMLMDQEPTSLYAPPLLGCYDCIHYDSQLDAIGEIAPRLKQEVLEATASWATGSATPRTRHHPASDCCDNYTQYVALQAAKAKLRAQLEHV